MALLTGAMRCASLKDGLPGSVHVTDSEPAKKRLVMNSSMGMAAAAPALAGVGLAGLAVPVSRQDTQLACGTQISKAARSGRVSDRFPLFSLIVNGSCLRASDRKE